LLKHKGVACEEVDVGEDDAMRARVVELSGRRTVPQIFIGATHVGGFDDLSALDREGRLIALLAG
jgi:glutaredoxin 3